MPEILQNKLLLFGALTQGEISNYIRLNCIKEEIENIEETLKEWRIASKNFHELIKTEGDIVDSIKIEEINSKFSNKLQEISNDKLFKKTFSALPIDFKMVEIDKLIATQRNVNLDYVQKLKEGFPKELSDADLIEICLSVEREKDEIKEGFTASNEYTFSCANPDFRFLGGFPKPVTEEDIKASFTGGLPIASITLLVGYGGVPINIIAVGNRMILNNGFHRVFALKERGIDFIPVVVQHVSNPDLEFPTMLLPKDYLIKHERPCIIKDFFDNKLIRKFKVKQNLKNVKISWGAIQDSTPI